MKMFSLRTIIDDILLLVRNNNVSESEDLSRAQIAAWVLAYKKQLLKQYSSINNQNGELDGNDTQLEDLRLTYGPLELEPVESLDDTPLFKKRTKEPIPDLVDKAAHNLYAVFDQEGCIIQLMNLHRRHYHYFRKYTYGDLTSYYENDANKDGYVYVQGLQDLGNLKYIWISGLFDGGEEDDDADEDDVEIPAWMIPDIKKRIMDNELAFMLQRISDDDNNSTLDGIKPQPQTLIANEK